MAGKIRDFCFIGAVRPGGRILVCFHNAGMYKARTISASCWGGEQQEQGELWEARGGHERREVVPFVHTRQCHTHETQIKKEI